MHARAAAAVVFAFAVGLVGLVTLAGGGAVATGTAAGRATTTSSCAPEPATSVSGSPTATPTPSRSATYPAPIGPRGAFARAYLERLGAPASSANLEFLAAWMTAESGPDTGSPALSPARYNPLNTTRPEPGSWAFNSSGVQNYPKLALGVTANADTTLLPAYTDLLAALRAGTDPIVDAQALATSPWGTGTLVLQILGSGGDITCTPPPASGDVAAVIAFAQAQLGKPYQWAAAGPDSYDCSGLTMAAYATIGITLPHNAAMQSTYGTRVPDQALLLSGDLVFFGSPPHHVGLYVGNGQMIDAPHTGAFVRYDPLWSDYSGAVRLVTASTTPSTTRHHEHPSRLRRPGTPPARIAPAPPAPPPALPVPPGRGSLRARGLRATRLCAALRPGCEPSPSALRRLRRLRFPPRSDRSRRARRVALRPLVRPRSSSSPGGSGKWSAGQPRTAPTLLGRKEAPVDSTVTYAMRDGPHLVEVRVHPDFVDWAGQDYAVVALADDPHPERPTWAVIEARDILGPWNQRDNSTAATTT